MEGFGDEALGDFGAIGVGGVDEGDTEFDGTAQDTAGFCWVAWLTPGAFAYQAHGAIAKAVYGQVAAD